MSLIRTHAWWVVLALTTSVAVGVSLDRVFIMIVFGAVNAIGALLFVEGTELRRPADLLVRVLAIAQLPVGILGLVAISTSAMPSSHTPLDSVARNLPRERSDSSARFGGPSDDRRR